MNARPSGIVVNGTLPASFDSRLGLAIQPTPEPATLTMIAMVLPALLMRRRRQIDISGNERQASKGREGRLF